MGITNTVATIAGFIGPSVTSRRVRETILAWNVMACVRVMCSGIIMGITNTVATIAGFIGPSVVAAFTANNV